MKVQYNVLHAIIQLLSKYNAQQLALDVLYLQNEHNVEQFHDNIFFPWHLCPLHNKTCYRTENISKFY